MHPKPRSDAPLDAPRRWLDAGALGLQAIALCYALALTFAPARYFARVLEDDASYYFQIARNAATGHGFTFDRLNPTDGFQPLWEWLLTAALWLHPFTTQNIVRLAWVLQSFLFAAAVWLLWRRLRQAIGSGAAGLAVCLLFRNAWHLGHSGMESALLFFVAAALLSLLGAGLGPRAGVGLGVTLAALMLARLDSVFWAGAFVLVLALSWKREDARRAAIAAFGVCALLFGAFLVATRLGFGHWTPIGGGLKSSFPHPAWQVPRFAMWGRDLDLFYQSSALAAGFLILRALPGARAWPSFLTRETTAASLGTLAHNVFSALFMKWNVFAWHFALSYLYASLALPALLVLMARKLPSSARLIGWTIAIAFVAFGDIKGIVRRDLREPKREPWTVVSWRAAQWVDAHLPRDAILAMTDAGNMGFYSGRRVVDLDGVANSWAYQDSLRGGHLAGFLRHDQVTFYAQHAFWEHPEITEGRYDTYTFTAKSHLYELPGGSIRLPRADEVYRSEPYWDGPYHTALVIWRLR